MNVHKFYSQTEDNQNDLQPCEWINICGYINGKIHTTKKNKLLIPSTP